MINFFHQLHVRALLILSPAAFFFKINSLDWYRETLHEWADDNKRNTRLHILELACETGSLSGYLHKQGHKIIGVDLSPSMIKQAKANHPKIDFYEADASNLPFKDNEFDCVLVASLINIAPSAEKIIAEMARVCKKGGLIKILVPAKNFDDQKLETLVEELAIKGFSKAALRTWHQKPPKMSLSDIDTLLKTSNLVADSHRYHLNEMLLSLTILND